MLPAAAAAAAITAAWTKNPKPATAQQLTLHLLQLQ
jgi:hypothetical protein